VQSKRDNPPWEAVVCEIFEIAERDDAASQVARHLHEAHKQGSWTAQGIAAALKPMLRDGAGA
jgi:hypothetical protein